MKQDEDTKTRDPEGRELDAVGRPGSGASREDEELVRRLLQGDEAAFASLIDRHHGALVRLAMVFVGDREVALEVVQETWLAVLEGISGFEGRSSLKTWIFRILTNRAKTRGTRERRFVPFSALADDPDEPAIDPSRFKPSGMWADPPRRWDERMPETLALQKEELAFLQEAVARLPPHQRAVFTLRDIEGLDSREVCNILEIQETNQRVLLHRARSNLRRALERHFDGK